MRPLPSPRSGPSGATTIILLVVILAAVMVLTPLILYVMVTGLVTAPQPGTDEPTATFSVSAWRGGSCVVAITSVSGQTVQVDDLMFQVLATDGNVYFSGAPGPGIPQNGVVVTLTYTNGGPDTQMGADDVITISVDPTTGTVRLHDASFSVSLGTDVLGTAQLP